MLARSTTRSTEPNRDWTPRQIEFLANIVRLWRGEKPEFDTGSGELVRGSFSRNAYEDVAGLCGVATIEQIKSQGWSLNPGRYVSPAAYEHDHNFEVRIAELTQSFEELSNDAADLTKTIRSALGSLRR